MGDLESSFSVLVLGEFSFLLERKEKEKEKKETEKLIEE